MVCKQHQHDESTMPGKEGYYVRRRAQGGDIGVELLVQTYGKTYGSLPIKNKSEHRFQSNAISVIVDSSCISSSVMSSVRNLANGDDASTLVDGILLLLWENFEIDQKEYGDENIWRRASERNRWAPLNNMDFDK